MRQLSDLPCGVESRKWWEASQGPRPLADQPCGFLTGLHKGACSPHASWPLWLGCCTSLAGNGKKKKKKVCPKQNVEIMWKLHGLEGVCRGGRFCIIGEMASSEENSTGGYFKSWESWCGLVRGNELEFRCQPCHFNSLWDAPTLSLKRQMRGLSQRRFQKHAWVPWRKKGHHYN